MTLRDRSATGQGSRWGQSGQATVEAVLVIPVVAMLALAIVQVGVVAKDRLLVAHVGREAARAAAVEPTEEVATAAARNATGLDADRLAVTLSPNSDHRPAPGDRVTVSVRYLAPTKIPVVGWLVPDVVLQTTVTVRVE